MEQLNKKQRKKWHISSNWIDKRANICKSIMALRNKPKAEEIGWKLIKKNELKLTCDESTWISKFSLLFWSNGFFPSKCIDETKQIHHGTQYNTIQHNTTYYTDNHNFMCGFFYMYHLSMLLLASNYLKSKSCACKVSAQKYDRNTNEHVDVDRKITVEMNFLSQICERN